VRSFFTLTHKRCSNPIFFRDPVNQDETRQRAKESMFFVRGLSSGGKEVFVNPDQVLYVYQAAPMGKKTALIFTHRKRLIVGQDLETVRQRFEEYLKDVGNTGDLDATDQRLS
jgi:hypothetical protein